MTYIELIEKYKLYKAVGTYEKTFPLTGVSLADSSVITWVGSPTLVQTKITGGIWETAINGGTIADATGDLTGKFLAIRIVLERIDLVTAPSVTSATATISQGGVTLFYGTVGIPETPTYSTGFETDIYSIELQSANALLRRRLISEAWQDQTMPFIVNEIFEKYIADEGITLGAISNIDFSYDIYVAQRKYVADVLDELVAPVGATWHIGPDKKFYFLTKEDFLTVNAPTHLNSVKKSTSGIDVRTVQVIAGATSRTALQTELFPVLDDTQNFVTGFPLAVEPTIYINGVVSTVGIKGIQSDDTTIVFLYSIGSNTITINTNSIVQPITTDVVKIEYIGTFEIEIENQNTDKINAIKTLTGTSGRIEKVETDSTIKTYNDGDNLAKSLLTKYGESDESITCVTDNLADTDLLTIWTFNILAINIVGDYIITERVISRLDNDKYNITLTLNNKKYYTKYGAIYNNYDKNVRRLSVNEKTVIIKTDSTLSPVLNITSEFIERPILFFATNGDYMDPLALIFPMECMV